MGATADPFVHLHLHSHYSVLDGTAQIEDLVKAAADAKMDGMALTDHGHLFGAIEFYRACKSAGIKPIVGCEAYIAPRDRKVRDNQGVKGGSYHLVLLAQNLTGWKNLIQMVSKGYTEGFYRKPRLDKQLLSQHSEGVIALTACLKGEVNYLVNQGNLEAATEAAAEYRSIFGDRFFLEIQDHAIPEQAVAAEGALKISKNLGIPVIATNDVHYLERPGSAIQDALWAIGQGRTLSDPTRLKTQSDEMYFKTTEEMHTRFKHHPEALAATRRVFEMVDLQLDLSGYHMPVFPLPPGKSDTEYLRELVLKGTAEKYGELNGTLRARIDEELAVINGMGFASYFLITWDFVRYARENGVSVGPGRGSAAGSLVAYSLGITAIDPLKYDLLFERFLNKARVSMPDIDIDFDTEGRDRVIQYVRKLYGDDKVAQIITFGTIGARAAVRDAGRILDQPLMVVDKVAKAVPATPGVTLADAIKESADFRKAAEAAETAELVAKAMSIEGVCRNLGKHAAGVVISDKPLTEYVPLYQNTDGDVTTQWEMGILDSIGMLKMDFLGLNTLSIIDRAVALVRKLPGQSEFKIETIPFDDPATFTLLKRGDTKGVFQVESEGFTELVIRLQPERFEEIIALIALYRPGPMQAGMVDNFVDVKHGRKKATYLHPLLEEILSETYGAILYQEQAMRIANRLAGFSLSDADSLRRAMGKKKADVMASYRQQFIEGANKTCGCEKKVAGEIWDQIEKFAGYGFNKSHSTAYAFLVFQTAYLKAHFPVEFMAGLISCDISDSGRTGMYVADARQAGIEVLPPDVNLSESLFSVVVPERVNSGPGAKREDRLRHQLIFGLAGVKGIGRGPVDAIVREREARGPFASILDFTERVDLQAVGKSVIETLTKAGAFDSLRVKRSQLLAIADRAYQIGQKTQHELRIGQKTLFAEPASAPKGSLPPGFLPDIPELPEAQLLQMEKDVFGFFMTRHPLANAMELIGMYARQNTAQVLAMTAGGEVLIGGMVHDLAVRQHKGGRHKGEPWAAFSLQDGHGSVKCQYFAPGYRENQALIKDDAILFIRGSVDDPAKDEGGYGIRVRVSEVITKERIRELHTRSVTVRLKTGAADEELLTRVRQVLLNNQGRCDVYLEFESPAAERALVRVSSRYFVTPSPRFEQEMTALLGDGALGFAR